MTRSEINIMPEKKFIVLFNQVLKRIKQDPLLNFVKAQGFMNFKPSPAQQVILKVIFRQELDVHTQYPIPKDELNKKGVLQFISTLLTEVEIYKFLTGREYDVKTAQSEILNKINLICGRRSGKTTLVAIIAIYCAITTNWKPFLHKTPFATVLIMSHSKEFSDEVLDIIKAFIYESPVLSRLLNKERKQTASTLNLAMPFLMGVQTMNAPTVEESLVQIKVGAASSKTTRGVAACVAMCDEIAFWNLSDSTKETDAKILGAVRPALKQFGKHGMLFKLSSPGIRQGVLYGEHQKYVEGTLPPTYAVFKAPTWVMNPAIRPEEYVEEYDLNPTEFMVEYGAEFADSISTFIMSKFIDQAVMKEVFQLAPDDNRELKYRAALDSAFKNDCFTFTLVAASEDRVKQFLTKGWRGSPTHPIKAHEVASWIKNAVKDYPIESISADQFAFSPLKEIFAQHDLVLEEHTLSSVSKKKVYFNLKRLIHSGQIDLLDIELQTKELKEIVVEQSPSGNIRIGHTRSGSDDFADSLAVAAMMAVEGQGSGLFEFGRNQEAQENYGIEVDQSGVAFQAPSPDMLVLSGHLSPEVFDNSADYGIDPADGRMKRWADFEGEDSGTEEEFSFGF